MKEENKKIALYVTLITYIGLVWLFLYYTRTPDYSSSQKVKAVVSHFSQKQIRRKTSEPFPVLKFKLNEGRDSFFCPLDKGFYFQSLKEGDSAMVIYNPKKPEENSFYTFPYYWLDLFDIIYIIFSSIFVLILLKQLINKNEKDKNININLRNLR